MLLGYVQNDLNIKSDLVKHSDTVLPFRGIRNGGIPFVGWSSVGQFLVQAVARQLNETNRGNTTAAFQCENSLWETNQREMDAREEFLFSEHAICQVATKTESLKDGQIYIKRKGKKTDDIPDHSPTRTRFSVLKMEFPRIYSKERSVRLSSTSVARARLDSDITSLDFAYSVTLNARWSKGLCVT
uniref:Uncharacterized protein n=1 Tax=Vespula pensylvanica TaxID=30213 RepID=A0A834UFB0_VESPE|nr:hypothetical protein H0235_003784 [Vespula pensylvanica]